MNSKKRCTYCKKYFPSQAMIKVPVGNFCCSDHIKRYGIERTNQLMKKTKAIEKKKHAKNKKDFYDNDLKTRREAAKLACHAYIRARDKGKPCICCGRVIKGAVHAGHFKESGNNPKIRYHEDNIHVQSGYCNTYKGGNSGDYELYLRKKIGNERVDWLKTQLGGSVKRTPQDYKEIELHYKNKIKELN